MSKFEFDWSQNSTKRGAVWLTVFVLGLIMVVTGQGDIDKLMMLGSGVAGGLGVALKD